MGAGLPTQQLIEEWGNVGEAGFKRAVEEVVHLPDNLVWGHEFPKGRRRGVKL